MLRVSIASILTKVDNNIGLHTPQMSNDLGYCFSRVGCIQVAIDIIQKINTLDTKHIGGCKHLGLTYPSQCLQAWIIALLAEPPAFSTCRGNEMSFDALGSVLREYAAIAQRFLLPIAPYRPPFPFSRLFSSP